MSELALEQITKASCYDGAGIICEVVDNETGEQVELYRNPLTGWRVA